MKVNKRKAKLSSIHRLLSVFTAAIILITSMPITIAADEETETENKAVIALEDTEGNLIAPIIKSANSNNTVYTRSGSNEALKGLGRNDGFKTYVTVGKGTKGLTFTLTDNFTKVYSELKDETDRLYEYLEEFNNTVEGDVGLGSNFNLGSDFKADYSSQATTDNERADNISQLKEKYDSFVSGVNSGNTSITGIDNESEITATIRLNRLRILSMAIEFQSLKVQALAGTIFPLDLMLVSEDNYGDHSDIDKVSEGVMSLIKSYTELDSQLQHYAYNDSVEEVMDSLTESYNKAMSSDEMKFSTNMYNLDLSKSEYIKFLQSNDSTKDALGLFTEICDLIDLWSTSPWSNMGADFKNSLVVDTQTDSSGPSEDSPTLNDIKTSAVGVGPFYTYLMADYKSQDNLSNNASRYFLNRQSGGTASSDVDSNRIGRMGLNTATYVNDKAYPIINTMYSQLQFPRYHKDDNVDQNYLNVFYLGATPATVYNKIFNSSGSKLGEPLHTKFRYYDDLDTTTIPKVEGNAYHQSLIDRVLNRSTSGNYLNHTSAAGVRGMNRFFITGLDDTVDGVDIMNGYFNTLLSVVSTQTFVDIMKNRYGYTYEINSDGTVKSAGTSDELKEALTKWDENEHYTFVYALNLLEYVEDFYNKFGKSVYTQEMRDSINKTIDFISGELKNNGLSPLMKVDTNKDNELNNPMLRANTDLNIVKDFVDKYEWGYELNADYKELFALTACFVPFETNLYTDSSNLSHVSSQARAKYRQYSRLRQPVSIVTKGSEQSSTDGIYPNLISNSPQKLEYCTLRTFIDRSKTGDIFLYTTAQSNSGVVVVDADVKTNSDSSTDEESDEEADGDDEDVDDNAEETSEDDAESETLVDAENVLTDNAQDGTSESTVSTVTTNKVTKSYSTLTSSGRYFGPIYGASNNPEYYGKYSQLIADKSFLENSSYTITEIASFYETPELAAQILTQGIESVDTSANLTGASNLRGDITDGEDENKAIVDYSTSTLMTLQMSPDALYMNFVNTYNMLQDKMWEQEGFTSDLDSFLYVDFLGNIVTESGYVVIPAAANATRYSSLTEYPIYNAMFLNSYPDVKQVSNNISLTGNDRDKYILFINSDFVADYNKTYNVMGSDTMFSSFQDFYTRVVPNEDSSITMYFSQKDGNVNSRLSISSFNFMSYISEGDAKYTKEDKVKREDYEDEDKDDEEDKDKDEDDKDKDEEEVETNVVNAKSDLETSNMNVDINSTIDSLTRNQRWFKAEQNKIKQVDGSIMDDVTFEGMSVGEVLDATADYRLGKLYFDSKVKSDTTLRTTYGRTIKSISNINNLSWLTMPTHLRAGFYACINSYIKSNNDSDVTISVRMLSDDEDEEATDKLDESSEKDESAVIGIPGKTVRKLPDDRILVSFVTRYNLINAAKTNIKDIPKDEDKDDEDEDTDKIKDQLSDKDKAEDEPVLSVASQASVKSYYAFNFRKSVVTITGLSYTGITGTAYLDHIPPYGISYEWLALKTLHQNLYNMWEAEPREVRSGVYTDCFINFNGSLGAMISAANGSEDTSVYDSAGNFLSGAGVSISDTSLKDDKIMSALGNLFESVYAPYLAGVKANLLTYMPTLDRTTFLNYVTIIAVPIVMVLLVIAAIVLIIVMATLSLRDYNMTMGDVIGAFLLTIFLGVFVFKFAIPTTKLVFEEPGVALMQSKMMMQGLYDEENETKDKSHTYFLENVETFESSPVLYMGKISDEDCVTYRKRSERAEVNYPLYRPELDGEVQYINDDIYMQGNGAYITMSDLFDKSNIALTRDSDNNLYLIHTMNDTANNMIYYTPFYNFIESITDTVNSYSRSCTGGYTVLNNKQGSTTTGRFDSYINSIFFISPDDIIAYSDATVQAEYDGDYVLSQYSDDFNYTSEQMELEDVQLQSGELVTMNADLVNTYKKMIGYNSDLNDWLQLKRLLYLVDDTGVFDDTYYESIESSRWYPVFDGTTDGSGRALSSEEVLDKIYKVNNNVKNFVLNNLADSSYYISDENLIKLTALKATFEFNKEFGKYFRQGKQDAYPREISGYKGNNDYFTKSMYVPLQDIYMGVGKQFSYYIGNTGGIVSLALITIERLLYMIRVVARMIALVLTVVGLFLMYVFCILRNRRANYYLSRAVFYSFILAHMNLLDILQYYLGYFLSNKNLSISTTTFVNLVVSVILTVIAFQLITKIWGNISSTIGTLGNFLPLTRKQIAYANAGYAFDDTSDMNQPSTDWQRDIARENYYNEPEADYDSMNDNIMVDEIPMATDVLPLGSNPDDLPEGYNLYEAMDENGVTSYYASKMHGEELGIAGGLSIHKSRYFENLDATQEEVRELNESNNMNDMDINFEDMNMPTGQEHGPSVSSDDSFI